jgi:hypothetical protein
MIEIGKKRLPHPLDRETKPEPLWGLIETAGDELEVLQQALAGSEYETRTKGERKDAAILRRKWTLTRCAVWEAGTRHQPGGRPAGREGYVAREISRTPARREMSIRS